MFNTCKHDTRTHAHAYIHARAYPHTHALNNSHINSCGTRYNSCSVNLGCVVHVSRLPDGPRCAVAICLLSTMSPQSFKQWTWLPTKNIVPYTRTLTIRHTILTIISTIKRYPPHYRLILSTIPIEDSQSSNIYARSTLICQAFAARLC